MNNQQKTKKQIIKFFKMVCKGIRKEYEQGASYRKLEVDVICLEELLNKLIK